MDKGYKLIEYNFNSSQLTTNLLVQIKIPSIPFTCIQNLHICDLKGKDQTHIKLHIGHIYIYINNTELDEFDINKTYK